MLRKSREVTPWNSSLSLGNLGFEEDMLTQLNFEKEKDFEI